MVKAPVVKVSVGSPGGNRVARILRAGAVVPEGVDEVQLKALAKRGMLQKLASGSSPGDPGEVPNKSAKVGEWRSHVVAAGLATEEEASKATKEDLIALVLDGTALRPPAPPAPPAPPVPPVDPDAPPANPDNPGDPVNPGDAGGSEGKG